MAATQWYRRWPRETSGIILNTAQSDGQSRGNHIYINRLLRAMTIRRPLCLAGLFMALSGLVQHSTIRTHSANSNPPRASCVCHRATCRRPPICRSWSSGLQLVPGRHVGIGPVAIARYLAQLVIRLAVGSRPARRNRSRRHRPQSGATGHRVAVGSRTARRNRSRRHRPQSGATGHPGAQLVPGRHVGIGPVAIARNLPQLVIRVAVGSRTARRDRSRAIARDLAQLVIRPAVGSRTARRDRSRAIARNLPQLVIRVRSWFPDGTSESVPSPSPAIWRNWSSGLQLVPGRHVGIGPVAIARNLAQLVIRVRSWFPDGTSESVPCHRPLAGDVWFGHAKLRLQFQPQRSISQQELRKFRTDIVS